MCDDSTEMPSHPASQKERRRLPVFISVVFCSVVGYLPLGPVSTPWDDLRNLRLILGFAIANLKRTVPESEIPEGTSVE